MVVLSPSTFKSRSNTLDPMPFHSALAMKMLAPRYYFSVDATPFVFFCFVIKKWPSNFMISVCCRFLSADLTISVIVMTKDRMVS
jgi:hypothetical protein